MKLQFVALCIVMQCTLLGNQHFGATRCLYLQKYELLATYETTRCRNIQEQSTMHENVVSIKNACPTSLSFLGVFTLLQINYD